MSPKLLIFDWDGTLADSVRQIVDTMQLAIRALKLPPREDAQIAQLIGLGFGDGLRLLYPEHDTGALLRLIAAHRQRVPVLAHAAPLFPGVDRSLSELSGAGYHLAVATGKSREGLDRSLQVHARLAPLFRATRCADETADKPNPRMLRELLELTGLAAHEALMIGDTEYDMAMARAIGMPALGVACGVHEPGRLLSAGAAAVVADACAVYDYLRRAGG
jgi:phosphoglycolate phosphatase